MKITTNELYKKAQIEYEILYDLLEEIEYEQTETYKEIYKKVKSWIDSIASNLNDADREKVEASKHNDNPKV